MKRNLILFILLSIIFSGSKLYANNPFHEELISINLSEQDSVWENQVLYNGRIWTNPYYMVKEDQFLFSNKFLWGSVTMRGRVFKNVGIMYDIYQDEILTPAAPGGIIQLNKEMVDSFSIVYQNMTYQFIKMEEDSLRGPTGFVNVLYRGKTALYIKFNKKIDKLAVDGKYDTFYQLSHLYLLKDNVVHLINSKSDLLNVFKDEKELIRKFIKKNQLTFSSKEPESFIPVLRYIDSIKQ
jgi:hypothetical protein